MPNREMESRTGLELPRATHAARLLGRALTLRCPHCGGGPVLKHWLKLRVRCGRCGLRLERGEHDYFMGSLLFNYIIAGLLALVTLVAIFLATAPDTPWDVIEIVLPVLVIALPFVLFPFSKLVWLAFDVMLRPVTPEELEWHRTAEDEWSTARGPVQPKGGERPEP